MSPPSRLGEGARRLQTGGGQLAALAHVAHLLPFIEGCLCRHAPQPYVGPQRSVINPLDEEFERAAQSGMGRLYGRPLIASRFIGAFTHKDEREHLAPLLGKKPSPLTPGTDHLRPASLAPSRPHRAHSENYRYRITPKGLRTAIFYTGLYNRSLRTGFAVISPRATNPELPIAKTIRARRA